MKEKVLVVAPTTASRLPLLKEVLGKLYDNTNLDIKTIVVKNGTYSDEEYQNFDFGLPNIIKTTSEPGGHIAHPMNVGMKYMTNKNWFVYQEDDIVFQNKKWLENMISIYKTIDNCGPFGTRLHGQQRQFTNTSDSLKKKDDDTFEVYCSDGFTLISNNIIRKHNLRYDEHMMTVPNACINLQRIELGYASWGTTL
jgi:Predicted glycosyltransferases